VGTAPGLGLQDDQRRVFEHRPRLILPPPLDLPPPPPGAVDPLDGLGVDWKSKDAAELKKLAEVVSGRAVENKKQAVEVIEAALAAR
jgi:hypothetical protein